MEEYTFCPSCGLNRDTEFFEFEGDRYYECTEGHCWVNREAALRWRDLTRPSTPAWRTQVTTSSSGLSAEMIRRWMDQAPTSTTPNTFVVDPQTVTYLQGQQWNSTPVSFDIETTGNWHGIDRTPPVSEPVSADPNPTQAQETPQNPNESEG